MADMTEGHISALRCQALLGRPPEHIPPLLHTPVTARGCPRPSLRTRSADLPFSRESGKAPWPPRRLTGLMPGKVSCCLPLRWPAPQPGWGRDKAQLPSGGPSGGSAAGPAGPAPPVPPGA